jgi:hypothetical protein
MARAEKRLLLALKGQTRQGLAVEEALFTDTWVLGKLSLSWLYECSRGYPEHAHNAHYLFALHLFTASLNCALICKCVYGQVQYTTNTDVHQELYL